MQEIKIIVSIVGSTASRFRCCKMEKQTYVEKAQEISKR